LFVTSFPTNDPRFTEKVSFGNANCIHSQ
jgi:hypothetical protein